MKRIIAVALLTACSILAALVSARLDAADPPGEVAQLTGFPGVMPQGVYDYFPPGNR